MNVAASKFPHKDSGTERSSTVYSGVAARIWKTSYEAKCPGTNIGYRKGRLMLAKNPQPILF